MYNKCQVGEIEIFPITIANGQTLSDVFNLNGYALVGIKFPTMTSTTITLQDSIDGVNFDDCYNTSNAAISWTITSNRHYKLLPADTASFFYLRLKAGSSEGAARTIWIICRGV